MAAASSSDEMVLVTYPRAGADDRDDVLGGVRHRQREEDELRSFRLQGLEDGSAASSRQVDVEEDDLGRRGADALDGGLHVGRLPHHLDRVTELGAHTRAEHLVVVDQEHARHAHETPSLAGVRPTSSTTSVPSPGAEWTSARPPCRAMRPMIDSRTPTRPGSTASRSKPWPRSRT
jgi:hypothetical protein